MEKPKLPLPELQKLSKIMDKKVFNLNYENDSFEEIKIIPAQEKDNIPTDAG